MNNEANGANLSDKRVYSTKHVGADLWRDAACHMFPGLSLDWLTSPVRSAWLGVRSFADTQVVEVACSGPARIECATSPATDIDRYSLTLMVGGEVRTRHSGRDEVWQAGDLMLFDSARSFEAVHPVDFHLLMWTLPREILAPMIAAPDRSVGVRIAGNVGPGAVLSNFLRSLLLEADRCDPATQRGMFSHLCGLIGLTLGATSTALESRRETQRAVRRQQILAYIEAHLRDPLLSTERVSRDLRLSRRWLHALLDDSEISFSDWVARRRLEECEKLLRDPGHDDLSVMEVAFRCGFNHLSTFNRRFRARYGMPPREARRQWQEERPTQNGTPTAVQRNFI